MRSQLSQRRLAGQHHSHALVLKPALSRDHFKELILTSHV
jgi:hypothetical protein